MVHRSLVHLERPAVRRLVKATRERVSRPALASAWVSAWASVFALGCFGGEAFVEPAEGGADFALQGEYAAEGAPEAAQVIAMGAGAFRAVFLTGGLPGEGWDGRGKRAVEGMRNGEGIRFEDGGEVNGVLLRGQTPDGRAFELRRVERRSPTLGAPPPAGAVLVFREGQGRFDGEVDGRGLLAAGASSLDSLRDARIHVEFRTPFMPRARGQARGNSGVYIQNRYEVQILDSFGLAGEWNECGGLYKVRKPTLNMAYPPLAWQTYDIEFRAARFDASGRKMSSARIGVRHNGVSIHENVELPDKTGGGDPEGPEAGILHLQDHWNPVFFRNVWMLATSEDV